MLLFLNCHNCFDKPETMHTVVWRGLPQRKVTQRDWNAGERENDTFFDITPRNRAFLHTSLNRQSDSNGSPIISPLAGKLDTSLIEREIWNWQCVRDSFGGSLINLFVFSVIFDNEVVVLLLFCDSCVWSDGSKKTIGMLIIKIRYELYNVCIIYKICI